MKKNYKLLYMLLSLLSSGCIPVISNDDCSLLTDKIDELTNLTLSSFNDHVE